MAKITSKRKRELFLRLLLPESHGGEVLFVSRNKPPALTNGAGEWSEIACANVDEVVKVATRSSREAEVYVALASFAPGAGKRGQHSRAKAAVVNKVCVSLDVDAKDMPGATFDEKQAQAQELVESIPAPSVIVQSGGGFHVHLRLQDGCTLADYASASEGAQALEVIMRGLRLWAEAKAKELFGAVVKLDHAHGVERVWRLAPSWNMKHLTTKRTLYASNDDWRPVKLLRYPESGTLERADLRFIEPFMVQATKEHEQHDGPKKARAKSQGAPLPSIADPRVGEPFDVKQLPFDLQATWPMDEGDQSEQDFRLACSMIEEGEVDPAVLAKAIRARRLALEDGAAQAKADRADYLARTVRSALHSVGHMAPKRVGVPTPTATPAEGVQPDTAAPGTSPPDDSEDSYAFTPSVPDDHFIAKHVRWCAQRTDAAHEFHEAVAIAMLAVATPKLKARISTHPGGLGTNLYLVLVGPSTTARKSTAISFGKNTIVEEALPEVVAPDRATPEAFIELLSMKAGAPTLWSPDEFVGIIRDIHRRPYMALWKEVLLTLYEGRRYTYKRRSKNVGKGQMKADEEIIEDPHLVVLGGATPALIRDLEGDDIEGGLMVRFGIVYPDRQPPRIPLYQAAPDADRPIAELQDHLRTVYEWCRDDDPDVVFDDEALRVIDSFDQELDRMARKHGDTKSTLLKARLSIMAFKVSMLVAVGYPGAVWEEDAAGKRTRVQTIRVLKHHAVAGIEIVRRWKESAERFTEWAEQDRDAELADRVLLVSRELSVKGLVSRRDVAQKLRISKLRMDAAEATLIDQGKIEPAMDGRKKVWRLLHRKED